MTVFITEPWFGPPGFWPYLLGFVFLSSLSIGSFANVMGLRLLKDIPLSHPPSHCPVCKTPLAWYDNIPVISYLLLKAKCRHCDTPISAQYPIVELATGLLGVAIVSQFGFTLGSVILILLLLNLMAVVITDWRESLIYHLNSLGIVPLGLAYNFFALDRGLTSFTAWHNVTLWGLHLPAPFLSALAGVLGAFALFEGLILISKVFFGPAGFGHGDSFLLMGLAAFFGWELALFIFLLGFMLQGLLAFPLLFWQWLQQKEYVNLGLAIGCLLCAFSPYLVMRLFPLDAMLGLALLMAGSVAAIVLLILFLLRLKKMQQFTYMPLGPALVVGALIALFGGQLLLAYYWGLFR
jgi:leader peptidase (prepilin peptidase) / N-methyltransferase